MAEWLVENGIGEDRAVRIAGGEILAARIAWPGELVAGAVVDGILVSRTAGSPRGTVRVDSGEDVLVDRLPREASEGAAIRVEITRARIGEGARTKHAQARPTGAAPCRAPSLAERLAAAGHSVRTVRRFPVEGWADLIADSFDPVVPFAGGALHIAPTPAMTLFDIDGTLPPRALALAAVPAIGAALTRFDIGGSIGIDFPTLSEKADRRAVDDALADALGDLRHERTAMNGFGFVQIVMRSTGPSILQRVARHRLGAAARLLLRRAEMVEGAGALLLTVHPAMEAQLCGAWLAQLARNTGREIRIETDPALAPETGLAQSATP